MSPATSATTGPPATVDRVEESERHGGRPLDASRDVALREAALALLAEIGYDRLTIDSVAARARASKTTIYRRWSGKAELVVDALTCLKRSLPVPDTGTLRGDLEAMVHQPPGSDDQFGTQLMIGIVTALARDAELRRVFRERYLEPNSAGLQQVFARAVARGEVPTDRKLDLLVSLLPALAIQHLLTFGEIPGADFAQRVIDDLILPLATAETSTSNTSLPSTSNTSNP
ncbi:MAG TPA: TetR/AcrR family transcriptional regulator [Acidimicrobiales bacterium]|nr:TetR/AcrR family transcriptional regulator [Acidimicrobiales bacterium]